MRAPTTVKLVRGSHPVTHVPRLMTDCGLNHRAAVVIDSYVPGLADMHFDSTLFLRFLQRIDEAIPATSRLIRVQDPASRRDLEFLSLAELQDFYHGLAEEDRDLPEDVVWFDEGEIVGGGLSESWHAVGGPEIYHDSFTFSVFTKTEIFSQLRAGAEEMCAASNARLLGVYEGTGHR